MKNLKKAFSFLGMAWKIKPLFIILLIANAVIISAQTFVNVILPKYLIDSLMSGEKNQIYTFTIAIIASNAAFFLLEKLFKRAMTINAEYITKGFHAKLADKVMSIEYKHLENSYYLDLKERAIFAVENQDALGNIVKYTAEVLRLLCVSIGLIAIMCGLSVGLVIFILITVVAVVLVQGAFSGEQVKFFDKLIPINRCYTYYYDLSKENKCQKDFRLYDMSGMISNKITGFIEGIIKCFRDFLIKMQLVTSIERIITVFQTAVVYGYVAVRCISGAKRIGIGSFTMYTSSAINFSTTIMSMGESVIMLMQMLNYLEPFMELLALPDEKQITGNVVFDGEIKNIRFENVTFAYPKTDKNVLDGVSFSINRGEKISIVGLNGAGKTTLVKLLCRLYRPDSGMIYLNGIDIFEYDYESYLSAISAVFQDYKLFNFSLEENITCKGIGEDTKGAETAAKNTGIYEKISTLPNGIKSLFGKDYDAEGIQLSGGQAQKLAIARALYKDAGFVIMDEPTSALDPIAEAEIYEQFNKLVGERTAIYISHRMSSSVFCDKVLILDGGKVADFAPHEELMKKADSLYYKMFMAQAVNYQV